MLPKAIRTKKVSIMAPKAEFKSTNNGVETIFGQSPKVKNDDWLNAFDVEPDIKPSNQSDTIEWEHTEYWTR
jgi:hypothetical protein